LRDNGLWENTIVVFMSDHGEEFGEHGGTRHKSTVYSEVTHVPFVMRIPGVAASESDVPMSTVYLWPWLLSQGDGELADHAAEQINSSIGPIIDNTGGGILTELIGHQQMKSTLVYPRMKINYDFASEFYELYDLQRDPLEQKNLFRTSDRAEEFEKRMRRYRAFRSQHERHTLAVEEE
jgi:arylsulfatase A-like enzyme